MSSAVRQETFSGICKHRNNRSASIPPKLHGSAKMWGNDKIWKSSQFKARDFEGWIGWRGDKGLRIGGPGIKVRGLWFKG